MADNVAITAGSGTTIAADELTDGVLGLVKVQYVKLMDGTIDGTSKAVVGSGGLAVNGASGTFPITGMVSMASGLSATINAGSNFIGLVSFQGYVYIGNTVPISLVSLPMPVSGTFFQTVQPISFASLPFGNLPVTLASLPLPVSGTFWQTTQPISYNGLISLASGTNVGLNPSANFIGLVSIGNQPTIGAGTNIIGKIINVVDTSNLYDNTTVLTPQFALISQASGLTADVVASVSGKKIRVLSYDLVAAGTVGVTFFDNAVAITGKYPLIANSGKVNPFNPTGWMQSSVSLPLRMNLDAAIAVGGTITYVTV